MSNDLLCVICTHRLYREATLELKNDIHRKSMFKWPQNKQHGGRQTEKEREGEKERSTALSQKSLG